MVLPLTAKYDFPLSFPAVVAAAAAVRAPSRRISRRLACSSHRWRRRQRVPDTPPRAWPATTWSSPYSVRLS